MIKLTGTEVLAVIMNGGIIEFGDRYYRLNPKTKRYEYSDYDTNNWKPSVIDDENVLKSKDWNKVN